MYISRNKLINHKHFKSRLDGANDPLSLFRETLVGARNSLEEFHHHGASAQDIVRHHAWLVDQLLHFAWRHFTDLLKPTVDMALVAVGGYGRGELHPYSDIDLLILLPGAEYQEISPFTEALLSLLWDIGLEVGHSVRSIQDCTEAAQKDITVVTNLMEARQLEGNPDLLPEMRRRTGPENIWRPQVFYDAKLAEQNARYRKFNETAYNLEPNIKEGPGGLRDLQTISWVVQRRYGVKDLRGLIDINFLNEEEYRALIRGRNFLWKLRNGLHYRSNRCEDRLLFEHQRTLAGELGYEDQGANLAVEQLMKRYYRTVKELRLLNEILLQHYEEENSPVKIRGVKNLNARFRIHNGYLETVDEHVYEQHPRAILETFFLLMQHPDLKGIRAGTIRRLRANTHRINQPFRDDIENRILFIRILRQPAGITRVLRRMNAYGVLGAYIPAFGGIVGQMQHDLFHVYTVDAHSLFVVRNLRRFFIDEFRSEFPFASSIASKLTKPERLYLAGLFHDIAKGRGGDHSILGESDALDFCKQHNLSGYDAHFVSWLVRHHLLMSHTAQKEDISDPSVILRFIDKVGDQEHLDNLYLLTVADIRGTSPHVWNAWKGKLLEELYITAAHALRLGKGNPIRIEDRIDDAKSEAQKYIETDHVSIDNTREHWSSLSKDYFLRYNARELAWHVNAIANTRAIDLPLVSIRDDVNLGACVFLIYAAESEPLLSAVTGAFEKLNLSITDARIHNTLSGFALYSFVVLTAIDKQDQIGDLPGLQRTLRRLILNPNVETRPRVTRMTRTMKQFPIETRVRFDSTQSAHTVMEVIAQDQPGLLHRVARCLWICKVKLVTAKIATFGERAEDIFIITDRDGNPVNDVRTRDCLASRIHDALAHGESKLQAKAVSGL